MSSKQNFDSEDFDNSLEEIMVLFSGGRDSSLVACLTANAGKSVHLFTANTGTVIGASVSSFRFDELKARFPDRIMARHIIPVYGLFRRIALVDIEADFQEYKKNLILLGAQLAIHSEAIIHCRKHEISSIASGFTRYQSHFPEQIPEAIQALSLFLSEYEIEYLTPVYDYTSEDEVKYRLLDFGISTKSLEGVSLFADTFSDASSDLVSRYISAKLPICKEYIDFRCR